MADRTVLAAAGKTDFDLLIKDVRIVNVFNDTVTEGCIGVADGRIAYVGDYEEGMAASEIIDGGHSYAVPGFVDSHMHLESSMLTPDHFAARLLSLGTTTVCADPHEIANVSGKKGIEYLMEACRDLPLRLFMMAPSTIPSAPGFEGSGYAVDDKEMEELLSMEGIYGILKGQLPDAIRNAESLERRAIEVAICGLRNIIRKDRAEL